MKKKVRNYIESREAEKMVEEKLYVQAEDREDEPLPPSTLQDCIGSINFPAKKEDLLNYARKQNSAPKILAFLGALPELEYKSLAAVVQHYGQAPNKIDRQGKTGL